jgi:hypothetical protein
MASAWTETRAFRGVTVHDHGARGLLRARGTPMLQVRATPGRIGTTCVNLALSCTITSAIKSLMLAPAVRSIARLASATTDLA